jgi:S-adenosylmethionine-diacylglycerol 3-amino-3-carboxypropyl transferase
MAFFDALNFSSSNEDGATEIAALAVADRILCLTGTGTRVLDLLLTDAREIVALDANPVQNFALALKCAAIERLERDAYLAFIGIAPCGNRRAIYDGLRHGLSEQARDFWDRNARLILAGLWTVGRWERLLHWNARALRLFRGSAVSAIMTAPDIDRQAALWQAHFVPGPRRAAIEAGLRDFVWRLAMREPAAAHLPDTRRVSAHIAQSFEAASRRFLFRESDIATLVFRGGHTADGALPVHLRAENFDRVRARLSRLRTVEADLAQLGTTSEGRFDGFSLSDFGSYCNAAAYAHCWHSVIASAAPRTRFCERIFMNEMAPPLAVTVDAARSLRLSHSDRSIIYTVRAGTINDPPVHAG